MSDKVYTKDLQKIITHGFDSIDPNEKVEVNLKDLMYVYSTLQEYRRFFHQPSHYQTLDDIEDFLGSVNDQAGYKILHAAVYEKMRGMFPEHIGEKFDDGIFDSDELPFYFNENRRKT